MLTLDYNAVLCHNELCFFFLSDAIGSGGAVVSWLVRMAADQEVRVTTVARKVVGYQGTLRWTSIPSREE